MSETPFEQVLNSELDLLKELRLQGEHVPAASDRVNAFDRAHATKLTGLAFSGGGIRSATFNLGVIMALAKSGLLSRFDYLSTVSGGGYVGAWLSAVLQRHATNPDGTRAKYGVGEIVDAQAVASFQACLTTHPADSGLPQPDLTTGFKPVEHAAVRYLRRYTRYLAPRAGLSGDLLAAVALFMRNLLLLQIGLIAALATVLMGAHLIGLWAGTICHTPPWPLSGLDYLGRPFGWAWPFTGAALGLVVAIVAIGRFLDFSSKTARRRKGVVVGWVMVPGTLAAWWFSMGLFAWPSEVRLSDRGVTESIAQWLAQVSSGVMSSAVIEAILWVGFGALAYTLAWVIGYTSRQIFRRLGSRYHETQPSSSVLAHLFPALFAGSVFGLILYLTVAYVGEHSAEIGAWYGIAFGTPLFILVFSCVVMIHIGVARDQFSELEREWFARVGGWAMLTSFAWALVFLLVLFAPPVMRWLESGGLAAIAAWVVGSGAGAWLARGEQTSEPGKGGWKQIVAAVAPWLFVIGLGVLVASGVHSVLLRMFVPASELEGTTWWLEDADKVAPKFSLVLKDGGLEGSTGCSRFKGSYSETEERGIFMKVEASPVRACPKGAEQQQALAGALEDAWRYRIKAERLILLDEEGKPLLIFAAPQSFGALVAAEHDRLTQLEQSWAGIFWTWAGTAIFLMLFLLRFDINLFSLHTLYRNRLDRAYLGASRSGQRSPDPITGFDPNDDIPFHALSLQRPIHIINTTVNMTGGDDLAWQTRRGASFAFTPCWAGFEAKSSQGDHLGCYRRTAEYAGGLSLSTLMAVSGAAASPNMGYHTSPAVAALLTAFNLRLGRWCGNPTRDVWQWSGPKLSVRPILSELTGSATGRAKWINLTDGGHFENLGIYELVRRRCRLILVSDAGCDPDYTFSDLASAIRKCWTDFGVHIDMPDLDRLRPKKGERCNQTRHSVGRIHYSDHSDNGLIIYLKASLNGKEPLDVREYADAHSSFPHEGTGDQFFDEDQFEGYRHLGFDIAAEVAGVLETVWRSNGWPPDYGAWPNGA